MGKVGMMGELEGHHKLPRLAEFYDGKTLFITGGTGFVGKALLFKLLKDLRCIRRAYLLVRPKKLPNGKVMDASVRLHEEVFRSAAFEPLREKLGEEFDKLVNAKLFPVEGDLMRDRLGLSDEAYERVCEEADIVINCAADVSFDAPLDVAIRLNAIAPRQVLEFVKACTKKPIFIHVSTCYVNGMREGLVSEELLMPNVSMRHLCLGKSPDDPSVERYDADEEVQSILKRIDEIYSQAKLSKLSGSAGKVVKVKGELGDDYEEIGEEIEFERIKERLISEGMRWARKRGWNDTYTFTKALGEQLIVRYRDDVSTVILRPAIIESGLLEPMPGWIEGLRMADPIIVGYGRGRLPDFPGDPNSIIDFVPVDFVVNALLCSAALAHSKPGLHVIHVATGSVNPLKFGELYRIGREYFLSNPLRLHDVSAVPKYPEWRFKRGEEFLKELHIRWIAIGILMALIQRFNFIKPVRKLSSSLRSMQQMLDRLRYYVELYGPYTQVKACYGAESLLSLYERLHEEDKKTFNFDVRSIDWVEYIQRIHIPGLLRYALHIDSRKALSPLSRFKEPVGEEHIRERHKVEPRILPDLVARAAAICPGKIAMQIKRDGNWVRYTYADVERIRRIMAKALLSAGVKHGSNVVLYSENQPEWGIAYMGASSLGATVVHVDRQLPPEYVLKVAEWADAAAIMASSSKAAAIREHMGSQTDTMLPLLDINNFCLPYGEGTEPMEPIEVEQYECLISPDDIASIILISGVGGEPKGVMLSHRNILSNVLAISRMLKPTKDDHFVSILPLNHALEFTGGFLVPLYACATITYFPTVRSRLVVETMREVGATCLIGVPRAFQVLRDAIFSEVRSRGKLAWMLFRTMLKISKLLYSAFGARVGRKLFSQVHKAFGGKVRAFISGGAALPVSVFDDLTALGFTVCEGYGLTEASPVVTVNTLERQKRGSVGLPLPGVQIRIAQPDERGIGEILVKGENVMVGYFKDDVATAQAIKDGWLHTGDLGCIDAKGYLYICGRMKEVIVTPAGKNVYPDEVEILYGGIPGVKEMCVVGVWDDEAMGETIHGVFVPDEMFWNDEDELQKFSKQLHMAVRGISAKLPSYQRIQHIHILTCDLPKTPAGGIDRAALRRALLEGVKPSVQEVRQAERTDDELQRLITEAIAQVMNRPAHSISPESHLEFDLGLDSLMRLELLFALEGRLRVTLPETILPSLHTVRDVIDAIAARVVNLQVEGVTAHESHSLRTYCVTAKSTFKPLKGSPKEAEKWLRDSALKRFCRWLTKLALHITFKPYFGFESYGTENLPDDVAFIIAANHCSHLDTCAILLACGKHANRLRILGAKDYFFNSWIRGFLFHTFLGVIPFDRHARFSEGLRMAIEALKQGYRLLVFPEGTRSPTGEMQPFKPGIGLLAIESGIPIVPAYIDGTFQALSRHRRLPRRCKITVRIGAHINPEPYKRLIEEGKMSKHECYKRLAADVQEAVAKLKMAM